MGHYPAQSKIVADRIVATTGIVVRAQLLTACTIGLEREIIHIALMALSSAQAAWHISMP